MMRRCAVVAQRRGPSTRTAVALRQLRCGSTAAADPRKEESKEPKIAAAADPGASRLPKFLLKESIIAPPGYNRYRAALPALATNICGGSVYAWSIYNGPLTRELGVVASCSVDWSLAQVVPVFSVNAACLGACTFATGKWLELVGPRAAGAVAAACFSSGLVIGGLGVYTHNLPLVYLGYGFLGAEHHDLCPCISSLNSGDCFLRRFFGFCFFAGGCGAGLSYVSPVSNMSKWFPDKRGLATGSAVTNPPNTNTNTTYRNT